MVGITLKFLNPSVLNQNALIQKRLLKINLNAFIPCQQHNYTSAANYQTYKGVDVHSNHVNLMNFSHQKISNRLFKCSPLHVTTFSHSFHSSCNCEKEKAVSKHVRQDVKFSEKAKEATKTTYYTAVVLAGLGITGLLFYTVFGELFASFSPQSVYSDAVKQCCAHPRVQDVLGNDGLKCYGEETRRGRRQHVSHLTYEAEGQKGMRIMFHIKGSRRTGTAWLDARDSSSGWYYRYLYVQLDHYPQEVIVIQDNRGITDEKKHSFSDSRSFSGSSTSPGELTPIFPPSK